MTQQPIDKMVKVWRKIKEARAELQANFDAEDARLKEQQEKISVALLAHCKELGADGFKTPFGTVSRRIQKRFWFADWAAAYEFILEHKAPHLLERRVAQKAMESWIEEHEASPEELPPSLQTESKYVVSITAPRNKA